MNYFELFGMKPSFLVHGKELERTFKELQKQLHPDNHFTSSEQAREFSHQQSQLVNDAYRTLRTPNLRAQYLLRMCGVPEIENGASGASVPMEFLEEMLDRCDETLRSEDVERLRQLRQECDSMTEQACQEAQRALDKKDMEWLTRVAVRLNYYKRWDNALHERDELHS